MLLLQVKNSSHSFILSYIFYYFLLAELLVSLVREKVLNYLHSKSVDKTAIFYLYNRLVYFSTLIQVSNSLQYKIAL